MVVSEMATWLPSFVILMITSPFKYLYYFVWRLYKKVLYLSSYKMEVNFFAFGRYFGYTLEER